VLAVSKWVYHNGLPAISTFSIVACDPATNEIGVAVQSKFLAVGAFVPWADSAAGAVATQSFCNTSFGPRGLELLKNGQSPDEVLQTLLADDPERELRQVGIVDVRGRSATFTGSECFDWAGGIAEPGIACQGNILAGPGVVEAMVRTFKSTDAPLPERLVAALAAGQAAGGDKRGMQSAALLVVKPGGGYGGYNDRYVDIRIDDHPSPIDELRRVLQLHRLYFERTRPEDVLALEGATLQEVKDLLRKAGYEPGPGSEYDPATKQALKAYFLTENFDERWTEQPVIDGKVLDYMRNTI
jgi:uncharacterized Ntn-hydrolase superfamily protein